MLPRCAGTGLPVDPDLFDLWRRSEGLFCAEHFEEAVLGICSCSYLLVGIHCIGLQEEGMESVKRNMAT